MSSSNASTLSTGDVTLRAGSKHLISWIGRIHLPHLYQHETAQAGIEVKRQRFICSTTGVCSVTPGGKSLPPS